jgi:hypothetical protein
MLNGTSAPRTCTTRLSLMLRSQHKLLFDPLSAASTSACRNANVPSATYTNHDRLRTRVHISPYAPSPPSPLTYVPFLDSLSDGDVPPNTQRAASSTHQPHL